MAETSEILIAAGAVGSGWGIYNQPQEDKQARAVAAKLTELATQPPPASASTPQASAPMPSASTPSKPTRPKTPTQTSRPSTAPTTPPSAPARPMGPAPAPQRA